MNKGGMTHTGACVGVRNGVRPTGENMRAKKKGNVLCVQLCVAVDVGYGRETLEPVYNVGQPVSLGGQI